jgi:signal transduction histidine kinase
MSSAEAGYHTTNQHNADLYADFASPVDLLAESSAGIAHDLGNLIQIASSAVNIVSRTASVRMVPALDPVIAGAKLSLERAGALIRQLTQQARDHRKLVVEYANLAACLEEIVALIGGSWEPDFHFDIRVNPNLPMVKCSPLDLQNAILNLVFNARAAMPDGGVISIAAVEVFRGATVTGVEIRIEDNGHGMTRDTMLRAFDPFFTTKTSGLGGLGLPIVKRFVLETGGCIDIESEQGIGTTVTLRLPGSASPVRSL